MEIYTYSAWGLRCSFRWTGKFEDLNSGTGNGMGSTLFMHVLLRSCAAFRIATSFGGRGTAK